jgi:hypothetical protein
MDKSDRAKLVTVMENRPYIEEWRATLTRTERLREADPGPSWASPIPAGPPDSRRESLGRLFCRAG